MKKVFCIALILLAAYRASAQLVIQPDAGIKTTNNVVIAVQGMDIINNDASTDLSNAHIMLKGGGNISLTGNGNWQIKSLTVDKSSGFVALSSPVGISERLTLTKGKLDLNTHVLTLAAGATIEGETNENRIIGPSGGSIQITTSLNQPSEQNPGKLGSIISTNANLGQVTIKRWHNVVSGEATIRRFYEIIPTNNAGLNATLKFQYLDRELNNINEDALNILGRNTSSDTWQSLGRKDKDGGSNFVTLDKISAFKQYALGPAGVLPLQWGPLTAKCNNGLPEIAWTTLQEENVQHFKVQQSADGTNWNDVATVSANGSSSVPVTYSYKDNKGGTSQLYRIMSIDIDGSKSYSAIKTLQGCNSVVNYRIHPVPATNLINVSFNHHEESNTVFSIIGLDGKTLIKKQHSAVIGDQTIPIDISRLASGSYYVQIVAGGIVQKVLPFVKQ